MIRLECEEEFRSLEDWIGFLNANPAATSADYIASVVEKARASGFYSRFLGYCRPDEAEIHGPNWRESLGMRGCNVRMRAVLDAVMREMAGVAAPDILMLEATTPFAREMLRAFPSAFGTEYAPTEEDRRRIEPIPHCDIQDPPFRDGSFDLVVSNDVMEHIPNLDAGLCGMRHVLRPGGTMLATFPFGTTSSVTSVCAVLRDGKIEHLEPPEYHYNPVNPERGSLVFAIPAWDILDRCRAAGFSDAAMMFVSSYERAITATELAGILILKARA